MTENKHELAMVVPLAITISIVMLGVLWYKLTLSSSSRSPPLPPGPRSLPIVGYLPFLGRDLHNEFTNMAHTYGPIFKFYLGSKLHVVINTPELAKEVVRDQDETFANRDLTVAASIIAYEGQDLIFSKNNATWRNLRKIFVHEVLSNKNLKACSSFRRDEVRKTIKNVFSKIGTNVDIREIAFLTESNVITRMIWDNVSYIDEKGFNLGVELQTMASNITKILGHPNLSDFFPTLAWFDLQGVERNMKKEVKKRGQIFESIIEDRIKSNNKMSPDGIRHEENKDFLQILLDLKDQQYLNMTQVNALLSDFMIAGTETTATLIEWAMANIMRNHTVLKKIQEELVEIVGLNHMVEESHLPKLQYLDATIKETFRLNPIVPFLVPRAPSKDCVVGGYRIPKGCSIFLNVISIHRNAQHWDNPLDFNPERFLANKGINKWDYNGNDLKFFPFGSGRRLCPGIPLAQKMQMFILASLLHSFDWSLPNGEEHDLSESFGLTLTKRKPLIAIPYQRLPDASLYM
ncbi:putative cytochrome P450 [Helianthus annuus]|uniref:Cytochrome P450 n=1 Tax=Helianthus annuus TaxID=4232 RepID=A0A251UMF6_HELAN|nr:labd-13Z-ene-9,15,16-triol synthase, chloroplastic [Helianthus annuus]KAF5812712.1 putative cytochrome P450 [Helianthus annuus]KAJ0495894.1 putative cytochrome P450 [Helianthus annuus]KAJ0591636.1 putative cytochrome P450 [Helianthus annuus]KAJ0606530.1 putative cytochrome P450 [Helianthus annuus]KAJ0772521.1 putative cytochrome P450 [Helianthus annuus]